MNKWMKKRFCFVFGHAVRYWSDEARQYGDGKCLVCGKNANTIDWESAGVEHEPWYFFFTPACFYGWVSRMIQRVDFWWCDKRGHDLVDEGYATPDSGCIDMVCRRCGFGYGRKYLY